MIDLLVLIQQCAPSVPTNLMHSLVHQESAFNPYAIGMDAKQGAVKQPKSLSEAIVTVQKLKQEGRSFSVGLAQIHVSNLGKYNMSWEQAFEPCTNLHTGELILWDFYRQALKNGYDNTAALWAMLRGYNSGNINASVSNKYASDILNRANLINSNLATNMQNNLKITTKINYEIPNVTKEEVGDQDIFANNENTQDIFNSSR